MANPQSGSISLLTVGRDLMLETGNISLASVKYKDSVQKSNTSVSLRDFEKHIWGNGRTLYRSNTGSGNPSKVKPHMWDQRYDNIDSSLVTERLGYEGTNGSPSWGSSWESVKYIPTAVYSCGIAVVDKPGNISCTIKCKKKRGPGLNKGDRAQTSIWVYGYDNGYHSGSRVTLLNETQIKNYDIENSFTFRTNESYPYLSFVFRGLLNEWNGSLGQETEAAYDWYDLKVSM